MDRLPTIPSSGLPDVADIRPPRSGLVDLALLPAASLNQADLQSPTHALATLAAEDVEIVAPQTTCCCAMGGREEGTQLQQRQAPSAPPKKHAVSAATTKLAAAVAETSTACGVPEAELHGFCARLLSLKHPSDQWAALGGQQLDSAEAVMQWRKDRRKLGSLGSRLSVKETSHANLMSIRPDSVRRSEVKGYQGLYQSMMRLRNDATNIKSAKTNVEERVQRAEASTISVGEHLVPRIRIAHLYLLHLAVRQPKGGFRKLFGGGRNHGAPPPIDVLETPRNTDESAKSRATDMSLGL